MLQPSRFSLAAVALLVSLVCFGCSKKIGDPCTLSADCGIQNNRQCDTAQLGGYCTQIGCTADGCPKEAACFLFQPRLSGCAYDDREPARTSRSFCMRSCRSDSNCRNGYVCEDVTQDPWRAVLLDVEELKPKACIVPATFADTAGVSDTADEPAICNPLGPAFDAGTEDADAGEEAGDAGDEPDDAGDDVEPDAAL